MSFCIRPIINDVIMMYVKLYIYIVLYNCPSLDDLVLILVVQ